MKNKKYIYILILFLSGIFSTISAQNISINITGTVKDAIGNGLSGVLISHNGEVLGSTDAFGKFSVKEKQLDGSIVFSLLGYRNVEKPVMQEMDVQMESDIHDLGGNIDLGFVNMPKEIFSGSAAVVYNNQLVKSPKSNLHSQFAGNLCGLTSHEYYSEVSREGYDYHVRGISDMHYDAPITIIDGVPCYPGTVGYSLSYISADEIESISVLKDAASQAIYGILGSNGIIVIKTRRGIPGKLKVDIKFNQAFHEMTTTPTFISSAEYAELRNQAAYNDGLGKNHYYSDEDIENYRAGTDPYLYPNTNWRSMMMRKMQLTQRLGINVIGGSENVKAFTNFNMMHVGGPYHSESNSLYTESRDKYTRNNEFFWFNLRANIDVKINKYLNAYMNVAGNMKKEHTPGSGFLDAIYPYLFRMPSTVYGPVTPTVENSPYLGNQIIVTEKENNSPYGQVNRTGYYNYTVTNVYANFGLNVNLDFITKGLSVTGDVAYMSNTTNSLGTTKNYRRYVRDESAPNLSFSRKGTEDNTNLSYGKSNAEFYDLSYRGRVNYTRNFGLHHINAVGYAMYQRYEALSIYPSMQILSGIDANYDYANRYALRLVMGYSANERYSRQSRWTTTPAVSAAWIISNEPFMQKISPVSLAKLRITYGVTAESRTGIPSYSYEDNVSITRGGLIGALLYTLNENTIGNPNLTPEKNKKLNFGVDLGLFNLVDFSIDIFKEKVNNAIVNSTTLIPSYQGIPLGNYPRSNAGSYENKGYEINLAVGKQFKNDFKFKVGGFIAYNKNKVIDSGETSRGEDYAYPYQSEGFSYGQAFGYLVDYSNGNGFYNFQSEIDHGPKYSFGTPRVGDLKYQDLNHDNVIDSKDYAPITYGSLPNYTYGITGNFKYKDFDLSLLFDAVGHWKSVYSGTGIYETNYDGIFSELHRHAWTKERWDNNEEITYPALSTKANTNQQPSDFFVYDRSFFRLKNLEIGYTLPTLLVKHIGLEKVRFVLSGHNLFTAHHMKTKDFGPELNSYLSIPIYRTYNVGVEVSF